MKLLLGIGAALFCVFFLSLPSGAQELPAPVPFSVTEAVPSFGPVGPFTAADFSVVVDGGTAVGYTAVYSVLPLADQCVAITREVISSDGEVTLLGCPGDPVEGVDVPYGFSCASPCVVRFASVSVPFALGAFRPPTEYGGVDFSGTVQDLVATVPTTTTTTTTTTIPVVPAEPVELAGLGSDGLAWVARFLLFALGMVIGR